MSATWDRNREGAWRVTFWPDPNGIGWRLYYGYSLRDAKRQFAREFATIGGRS
jgi:hypothetical protein